jgi:GMP synthase (glutamine-hydrolysing)
MILVANCLVERAFVADFNRVLTRDLAELGQACRCFHASELAAIEDPLAYSHLILSGSEASTTETQPWDAPLAALVRTFVDAGRPVLGICYGHQFLAKTLAGPEHVRRAARSEFGWLQPRLEPNPLFRDLEAPEFMACHFDEACDLPADFHVLAASDRCAVHAFQYRDLPVWGVQFHPEYGPEEAGPIFRGACRHQPELIPGPPREPTRLDQRKLIFRNFVKA